MNTEQIDIAVDYKVNCEITKSSNNWGQHKRHIADIHCETNIKTQCFISIFIYLYMILNINVQSLCE